MLNGNRKIKEARIYHKLSQEKEDLRGELEEKAAEVRREFASENSKLKRQLESTQKELDVSELKTQLEAIKNASDSTKESVEELRRELKQIDVNKAEAEFVFKISDTKAFFNLDAPNVKSQANLSSAEVGFGCARPIHWIIIQFH